MARANGEQTRAVRRFPSASVVALAVYVVVTLLVLAAVLRDPAHRTFRSYSGDNFADCWNLWWVHEAIAHGQNIFFTKMLYFPVGTSLSFAEFFPLYGLLSAPFFAVSDSIAAVVLARNLWGAATFVLCGWATFLFARRLSGSAAGAMIAGLLVAFAPFRIHHLEHLNLLSYYWTPLTVMAVAPWILDSGKGSSPRPRPKPGWGLLALAACGAGLAGTGMTNLAVTATLIGVWLAWTAILDRSRILRGWFWRIPVAGAAVAIGTLPFTWEWFVWLVKSRTQGWSADILARWSPDLFGFFTPPQGALLGGVSAPWVGRLHGEGGNEVYLGFVFLVLAVAGVRRMGRPGLVLLLTAATGFFLSLGPGIWVGGHRIETPLSVYGVLEKIFPFVATCRVPSRFVPMIFIALAPLVAAGFARTCAKWGRLAYLLVPLALAESLIVPRGYEAARVDNLYTEMRDDATPGAVYELALQRENFNLYSFHQIVHRRPLVGGHPPRLSMPAVEMEAKLDLRGRLTRAATAAAALEDLRDIGAAFFVLHRAGVSTEAWQQVTAFFDERAEVWNRSRERVVYRLRRDGPAPEREPESEP